MIKCVFVNYKTQSYLKLGKVVRTKKIELTFYNSIMVLILNYWLTIVYSKV